MCLCNSELILRDYGYFKLVPSFGLSCVVSLVKHWALQFHTKPLHKQPVIDINPYNKIKQLFIKRHISLHFAL